MMITHSTASVVVPRARRTLAPATVPLNSAPGTVRRVRVVANVSVEPMPDVLSAVPQLITTLAEVTPNDSVALGAKFTEGALVVAGLLPIAWYLWSWRVQENGTIGTRTRKANERQAVQARLQSAEERLSASQFELSSLKNASDKANAALKDKEAEMVSLKMEALRARLYLSVMSSSPMEQKA